MYRLALDPDSLEEAFGSNFADGAELLVVEAEDLHGVGTITAQCHPACCIC